jgi:hypothetical protein
MKAFLTTIAAVAMLAACGTNTTDRGLSGAGIGAGIGLLGGPVGVVVGAAAGAATGAMTRPDQIDLGKPVWRA